MKIQTLFSVLLVLTLVACSTPAPVTTPAPTSPPTSTPTATPEPTNTPKPTFTPTLTPTSTPLPTSTPTLTATPPGIAQVKQSDGSIKTTDEKGGYELTLPKEWVVLDLSSGDWEAILASAAERQPENAKLLESARPLITQGANLLAVDTNPDHLRKAVAPTLVSVLDTNTLALPIDFLIKSSVQSFPEVIKGTKVLSSKVTKSKSGVELGTIDLLLPSIDQAGKAITIYEKMVMFKTQNYTVMFIIVALPEQRTALAKIIQGIMDSITVPPTSS